MRFEGDVGDTHGIAEATKSINDIAAKDIFYMVNMGKLESRVEPQLVLPG